MSFDPPEDSEESTEIETAAAAATNDAQSGDEEVIAERASQTARKLEPVVLAHISGPKYQPVKPRVIAKQLKLPSEQHRALKLAIKRLVKAGKLVYGAGHIVRTPKPPPPAQASFGKPRTIDPTVAPREKEPWPGGPSSSPKGKNIVTGTFRRTSKGFGFVRPQGAKRGDKAGDIYIAAGRRWTPRTATWSASGSAASRRAARAAPCGRPARSSKSSSATRTSSSASIRSASGTSYRRRSMARCSRSRCRWAIPARRARPRTTRS